MPDTKNISGPPLRSPDTLRSRSKGITQKASVTSPMKVKGMRSTMSVRRAVRRSTTRSMSPKPMIISVTPSLNQAICVSSPA